jgi:hypothetical protein
MNQGRIDGTVIFQDPMDGLSQGIKIITIHLQKKINTTSATLKEMVSSQSKY